VSSCFLSSDKRCDGSLECCMFSGSHQARALLSTHCLLARGVVEGIQFQALASDKIRTNILSEGYKNSVWLSSLGEIFCCECSTQSPPRSQVWSLCLAVEQTAVLAASTINIILRLEIQKYNKKAPRIHVNKDDARYNISPFEKDSDNHPSWIFSCPIKNIVKCLVM